MKINWETEKEHLQELIDDKVSYEAIGRMYSVSGTAIKKVAIKLGIEIERRRKINPKETFKGRKQNIKYICKNCGKEFKPHYSSTKKLFCSNKCLSDYNYKQYIERWKNRKESGIKGACAVSGHIKRYLFEKYLCKCKRCGWNEINLYTKKIPLEIHHIDGDCTNNSEDNLELLCPNCHSLTENFGNLNKNSKRFHRSKITLK